MSRLKPLPEQAGKYPVVGLAETGNMDSVYAAYDPFTNRDVALKACTFPEHDDGAAIRNACKLSFNEAQRAGALDHRNILRVYDVIETCSVH